MARPARYVDGRHDSTDGGCRRRDGNDRYAPRRAEYFDVLGVPRRSAGRSGRKQRTGSARSSS
jgi:hypothetical protein